jgi:hypothetical protein
MGSENRPTVRSDSGRIVERICEKLLPWYKITWVEVVQSPLDSRTYASIDICGMEVAIRLNDEGAYRVQLIDAWDNNHPEATREHIEKILNGWTRDDKGNLHPPANYATDS